MLTLQMVHSFLNDAVDFKQKFTRVFAIFSLISPHFRNTYNSIKEKGFISGASANRRLI